MAEIVDWLRARLSSSGELPADAGDKNLFQLGAIDSFGVIVLIEEIEQHFGIRLDERDFQDRRFPTIDGLAEIISEHRRQ